MADIQIGPDSLTLHLWLHERVLAMHGSVSVPLLAITRIDPHPEVDLVNAFEGSEFRGTFIPGRFAIGTDHKNAEKADQGPIFFDVRDKTRVISVEVEQQPLKKLVFSVNEPDLWAERLRLGVNRARERAGRTDMM